jgi:inorganic pyrophosphatase
MIDYWRSLSPGPDPPRVVYVVTEMARGSRNKYEYDVSQGFFKLDRVLYTYFPCDYGFIPQTLDDDGDPLDAVLLINEPTFTGCVTTSRPVANIKMMDGDMLDDKIVTVSTTDPFYRHINSLNDIPKSMVSELTFFFENYKQVEGRTTRVERWEDIDDAIKIIDGAMRYYEEKSIKKIVI